MGRTRAVPGGRGGGIPGAEVVPAWPLALLLETWPSDPESRAESSAVARRLPQPKLEPDEQVSRTCTVSYVITGGSATAAMPSPLRRPGRPHGLVHQPHAR